MYELLWDRADFFIGIEAKLEEKRPRATRENQAFHQIPLYVFCILAIYYYNFFQFLGVQGYDIHMLSCRVQSID